MKDKTFDLKKLKANEELNFIIQERDYGKKMAKEKMTIRELYKQLLGICREYNARLPESDCTVTPKRLVAQLTFTDDGEIKETMIPIAAPLEEAEFLQSKLSAFGKIRKHMKIFAGSDENRIIANLKKFDELANIELQRTIKVESGGMI